MMTLRLDFHIGRVLWVTCQGPVRKLTEGGVKVVAVGGVGDVEGWRKISLREGSGAGDIVCADVFESGSLDDPSASVSILWTLVDDGCQYIYLTDDSLAS